VDNAYLSEGPAVAWTLCKELGISKSAFYRHIKSHLSLSTTTSPSGQAVIEWCRAASNLAAAVEQYRIIVEPSRVSYIGIHVGVDDAGQFVELAITYTAGALDEQAVSSMRFDLNLDLVDAEVLSGMTPTRMLSMKLHAPEVFVGRKERRN
jgi:hypothetical protein